VFDCDFVESDECCDRDCGYVNLTYFWKEKKEDQGLSAQISCLVQSLTL
jgi:hypothetical protein